MKRKLIVILQVAEYDDGSAELPVMIILMDCMTANGLSTTLPPPLGSPVVPIIAGYKSSRTCQYSFV